MLRKKAEQIKYEQEISRLNTLLNSKAREVSELDGKISEARSVLQSEADKLKVISSSVRAKLDEAVSIEAKISSLRTTLEGITNSKSGKIQLLNKLISDALSSLSSIEDKIINAKLVLHGYEKKRSIISSSISRLITKKESLESAVTLLIREEASLKKVVDSLKDAIEQQSAIASKNSLDAKNNEIMRGKLEHYTKRLQRIYDKSGIKIDLLKQFNIKRDNI